MQLRKKYLLLLVGFLLLAGSVVTILLVTKKGTPTPGVLCLTKQDYKDFVGRDYQGAFAPKSNFYTKSVYFDGTEYADKKAVEAFIDNVGKFYKNHPDSALYFNITSDYITDNGFSTSVERLNKVVSDLTGAGVEETVIRAVPNQIEEDGEGIPTDFVSIAITTPETCEE